MRIRRGRRRAAGLVFRKTGVLVLALSLTSCGGGGGGSSPSASVPPPSGGTIPTPLTLLPQTNILSTEFYNSTYLQQINAYGAYLLGATGSGVNVAVIDGGIEDTSHELQGQVLQHIDVTGANPAGGEPSHGTSVASIIAAKRDDAGVEGVAYNAQLYDLNVFGPGGSSGPIASQTDIAKALEIVAGRNSSYPGINARIVNMSLGGSSAFGTAVNSALADVAAADKVIVIAAGNDGGANPSPTAQSAANAALNGQMLIVGAVDANNVIASFSNRAGSFKNYYVVAPGVNDPAVTTGGGYVYFSGTSAATPVVSGMLAVIAQAYPYLSAAKLVALVEQTADDLGDPGVDAVYGWGLVDLTRAMSPVAPLSLPTGSTVASSAAPASSSIFTTGSALGAPRNGKVALFDAFDRPYTVPLNALGGPAPRISLFDRVSGMEGAATTLGLGALLAHWYPETGAALSFGSAVPTADMGQGVAMAFGDNIFGAVFRNARPAALTAMDGLEPATAAGRSLFLVTDNAAMPEGAFIGQGLDALAYGFRRPDYAGSLGFGQGRMLDGTASQLFTASLALPAGRYRAGVATGLLDQTGGVLGAYGGGAFHDVHGRTFFTTVSAGAPLGRWSVDLAYTHASLQQGALGQGLDLGKVEADALALTFAGPAGLRDGDLAGIRLAQPLRATAASIDAFLPVGRSYDGDILRAHQTIDMSPTGRELDLEAAYTTPLPELDFGGVTVLRLNTFLIRQPGNDRTAAMAVGAAAQLVLSW